MNKIKMIAAASVTALTFTTFAMLVHGDELVYDSSSDPLVSLSYINDVVIKGYEEKLAELSAEIDELSSSNTALLANNESMQTQINDLQAQLTEYGENGSSAYTVVYLTKGAKLMADTPCEIILRSGSAIAVSITINGLNDISDGTEILNAEEVPLYHCLLVPRGGDGRGIQITSAEAYIMVRGEYQIVK